MCGRYVLGKKLKEVMAYYGALGECDFQPHGDVAPGMDIPVLVWSTKRTRREMHLMRWGYVATGGRAKGAKIINARSETVCEKLSYAGAIAKRRCIIPISGYYEWAFGTKERFLIKDPKGDLLSVAGIWSAGKGPLGGGCNLLTCAILTQSADKHMQETPVHERMPVLLDKSDVNRWITPQSPLREIQSILKNNKVWELTLISVKEPIAL